MKFDQKRKVTVTKGGCVIILDIANRGLCNFMKSSPN